MESPRGFLVSMTNSSPTTLVRKSAVLTNGSWGVLPPEVRAAGRA
jgi:hypothetical protein